MEQGIRIRIRIRTVILLWLLMFVVPHSYAQDYSTWGDIYDYEVGDIFQYRNEALTNFGAGYIRLVISEITDKYYSTNSDTIFYERWVESAYMESPNPDWVFDSYHDTLKYTNLSSFCIADSVYSSNAYNGRQISYIEIANQHPYYQWRIFVNGCGRVLDYNEEAWPYPYFGYWEEIALKYFKKGDEEWGTPLTIVGINEQKNAFQQTKIYPNPFATSTTIEYELYKRSNIQYTVYNSIGEVVYQHEDRNMPPGRHKVTWSPGHLPAGLYYAVLRSGDGVSVVKMVKQ